MTPTERGAALLEPVKLALAQLDAIVTPPAQFEANVCRREFNIGSPDYLDARAVGDVLARMQTGHRRRRSICTQWGRRRPTLVRSSRVRWTW